MQKHRPVNLQLTSMKFPITAIISILHRISGVFVFLFVPFLLNIFSHSLQSPDKFSNLTRTFLDPVTRFALWVSLSAFIYHFVAGIRHLLMDCGIGEELASGRRGAYIVLVISSLLIILTGIYLWV
jgi:succinate dehydrogenase / fumarate reductase cytochrome b subunit